ncbi:1944_t:CDS:2, partial [Gigaspora rosea]
IICESSDVDICFTTPYKELENRFILTKILQKILTIIPMPPIPTPPAQCEHEYI